MILQSSSLLFLLFFLFLFLLLWTIPPSQLHLLLCSSLSRQLRKKVLYHYEQFEKKYYPIINFFPVKKLKSSKGKGEPKSPRATADEIREAILAYLKADFEPGAQADPDVCWQGNPSMRAAAVKYARGHSSVVSAYYNATIRPVLFKSFFYIFFIIPNSTQDHWSHKKGNVRAPRPAVQQYCSQEARKSKFSLSNFFH
jgi:hypothetical protein